MQREKYENNNKNLKMTLVIAYMYSMSIVRIYNNCIGIDAWFSNKVCALLMVLRNLEKAQDKWESVKLIRNLT